jgi:hypothetical protein
LPYDFHIRYQAEHASLRGHRPAEDKIVGLLGM